MTISVIIAAYNAEATLAETLASVLGQTLLPDEIIVVDDGSTDHTAQVAAAASNSIRVIRQNNRGAAAALNMGVKLATGDALGFVDADDLWERDKLAMQARVLAEQPELDGTSGHVSMFLCPTNDQETNKRYRLPDGPEPCWLLGAMLLRRHCFERCEPFAENLWAGFFIDWYDRARAAGLVFGMIPNVLLHRRIRPGSLSHRSHKRDVAMVEMARRAIERRRGLAGSRNDGRPSALLARRPNQPVDEGRISFRYSDRRPSVAFLAQNMRLRQNFLERSSHRIASPSASRWIGGSPERWSRVFWGCDATSGRQDRCGSTLRDRC